MYTYNDFEKQNTSVDSVMRFIKSAITSHKGTMLYDIAVVADMYDRHMNKTIMDYQKMIYTFSGAEVPDIYAANHKLCSNFFNRFITQENQYLLGNGVTWQEESTSKKLGKDFDQRLQELGRKALVGGVAFGFWNYDHLETFSVTEFVPLYDENDGALKAGIRYWQVSEDKPLRATLYELDGITEFMYKNGKGEQIGEKKSYIQIVRSTIADGVTIYDGMNYPTFPIVPLYGNPYKQSEIVGLRTEIDAYDLIQSGFANDLDDASQIYWIIENAGGMDDLDVAKFLKNLKERHATQVEDDGAKATPHTIDIPYLAREAILDRLEKTMYKDAMALNVDVISGGATTATQIRAAYEPLNSKCDQYEMCVIDFIQRLLAVAEIEDTPTFTRSKIINTQEEIQSILNASEYLPSEYITEKILNIMGDGDRTEEMLDMMEKDIVNRFAKENTSEDEEQKEEQEDNEEGEEE